MINYLSVKNYALIDSVEIEFNGGLSTITGETGAGKSILLGAMSLILGQRADVSALKDKEKKCIVEGSFTISGHQLEGFFKQNEIDFDPETTIRREINSAGKSRAFINDTPVNLNTLRELSLRLVDIHSQHQNLNLNESVFQLSVIDTFAGNSELLLEYKLQFENYSDIKKQLESLKTDAGRSKEDFDYFRFRFDELEKANLKPEEQSVLEEEQKTLNHAEEIKQNLSSVFNLLSENPESVLSSLSESIRSTNQIAPFFPKIQNLIERIESTYIELKDINSEIELLSNQVEFNLDRAEFVNERLNLIYSLQQKHNANSVDELLLIKEDLYQKINDIESFDDRLKELQNSFDLSKTKLEGISIKLSNKRKKSFPEIEKYVIEQLISLGMPSAVFLIHSEPNENFTFNGKDKINFLFSANKNGETKNISKVASGGEVSRLMLSIKSLLSKNAGLPSIIFDEIDTGVSGEIAYKMGNIMQEMSEYMQVVSITHLPQVAAKGSTHYLVYKEEFADKTSTMIKKLSEAERLHEIAKMLSGENLSEQALENAKVLLEN